MGSIHYFFFQKYQQMVGVDVSRAVMNILNGGDVLAQLNHTNMVLTSKITTQLNLWILDPLVYAVWYIKL